MIFLQYIIKFEKSNLFKTIEKEDNLSAQKYKIIIQNQINNFSSLLCDQILKVYIESPVEQITEAVRELLIDFILYQKPLVIKGMEIYLKDFPNDILTNKEKNEFIKLIQDFSENENEQKKFNYFIDNLESRCISKQIRSKGQN